MKDFSAEELRALMENAVKNLHMSPCPPVKAKDSYCYQDEDGIIHMRDETGFHCMMGEEFFEALLKMKEPKSFDDQVKDALVSFVNNKLKTNKRPAKPWYRRERW